MTQTPTRPAAVGAMAAREQYVEADGFRIRYLEVGSGTPLICLHGAGGLNGLAPAAGLLAEKNRVIALELPGFGTSPENTRSQTADDLAGTVLAVADALGIQQFNLQGTSFGSKVALAAGLLAPERVLAVVLESPAAIRPENQQPPTGLSPEEMQRRFQAHPERHAAPVTPPDPAIQAKTWPLVMRILGPNREPAWEHQLRGLTTPVLVLFGTQDGVIPPEMGREYKRLIPNCSYVLVYNAAHDIQGDRPEAYAEVVQDFLERQETFVVNRYSTIIHP